MFKPEDDDIPAVVAYRTGLPLHLAPAGLVDRLRGTDLDSPGDILRAVWILLQETELDREPESLETKLDAVLGELRALAAVASELLRQKVASA